MTTNRTPTRYRFVPVLLILGLLLPGLSGVAFVKNLSIFGQKRSAIPDFAHHILFLDINAGTGYPTYQRHIIHHELFHILDQQVSGNVYHKDPDWTNLNEPDFTYGNGGASMQNNANAYPPTHPRTGFINLYSQSAVEEDKAELFAALFTNPERPKVPDWSATDNILNAKISYLKIYLPQQSPEIDDTFWNGL